MPALRILCLGDSITQGPNNWAASYRWALWRMLTALEESTSLLGDGFAFVGSTTTANGAAGANSWPDQTDPSTQIFTGTYLRPYTAWPTAQRVHSGVAGNTIEQMRSRLADDVTAHTPDLVLLHAGQNNTGAGYSAGYGYDTGGTEEERQTIIGLWASLVVDCLTTAGASHVIAATLQRVHNTAQKATAHPEYNEDIRTRATTLQGEGRSLSLVELESALALVDDYDDTSHPGRLGYEVIAGRFFAGIVRHLLGDSTAMTLATRKPLANALTPRIDAAAHDVAAIWLRQGADSTRVNAPASGDTSAVGKLRTLAGLVLKGEAEGYLGALRYLVAADPIVAAQAAAGGHAAVTDGAIEDAVYLAWRHVAGVTAGEWPS